MLAHEIVIVGGGAAGIAVAASLLRRRPGLDIAIVEPSEQHYYQPGFTLIGAGIFAATRMKSHHRVPQEALIGITYVVAAAAGILLLSRTAEGNEELRRTLIGDVLLVSRKDVLRTFLVYLGIGAVHFIFRKKFLMISFEPDAAAASGMAVVCFSAASAPSSPSICSGAWLAFTCIRSTPAPCGTAGNTTDWT